MAEPFIHLSACQVLSAARHRIPGDIRCKLDVMPGELARWLDLPAAARLRCRKSLRACMVTTAARSRSDR